MPQGCGCAACQAASKAALSSDYTGVATGTIAEANSLYSGFRWGAGTAGITLYYKFLTALPNYYSAATDESHNFQTFNNQMQVATGRILEQIESFTNINFVETTASYNQLSFAQATLPAGIGAWAYYPSTHVMGGDVWTNNIYSQTQTPTEGNYGFYTLMHEIGHALGLQHSFTAGLTGDEASSRYSVMAYDWSPFFSSSYMVYDIAALQKIYGANMNYHTGADTYVTNASLAYTIWDAGGNDTLDASAQNTNVTLDLRAGEYSTVGLTRNIGIAYGAVIENANGGNGNDVLIGNAANNILTGNGGNDTFVASSGIDNVFGGSGSDLLIFDTAITNFYMTLVDALTIAIQDVAGAYGTTTIQGVETVQFQNTNFSFDTLASMHGTVAGIEMLDTFSMSVLSSFKSGGKTRNVWTGVSSSLEMTTVYQGNDFRYSFANDMLVMDRNNDSGHEALTVSAVAGYEGYIRGLSITDTQNIDEMEFNQIYNLTLKDASATQNLNIEVIGGTALSLLTGLGSDTIEVTSSAVGKTSASYNLSTGAGNDIVHVEGTSTKMGVAIAGGEGDDTISVTMTAGAKLYGDDGHDTITGGNGADIIYGGAGNDLIHGGTGNDGIDGGADSDTIYGDLGADSLSGGAGNDIIDGGAGNDTINGGADADWIYGGTGLDVLVGGTGADIFVFDYVLSTERDMVRDYNAAEDVIDISAIMTGYDPLSDLINDFIRVTYNSKTKASFLQVDTDGTDTANGFVIVAQVNGLRGHNIEDLIHDNHIVIA